MLLLDALVGTETNQLMAAWEKLSRLPGGGRIFSRLVGQMAPYTGTVGARVEALAPGFSRVTLRDRRAVRNHLSCVHAVALINLGELTTGLAMMAHLAPGARGIVTHLGMDYLKKARGPLTAECRLPSGTPQGRERAEVEVVGSVRNAAGEEVARATARWRIGP